MTAAADTLSPFTIRVLKNNYIKSTQFKELAPNALQFTYQNLKFGKPHEKTKQKTSKC